MKKLQPQLTLKLLSSAFVLMLFPVVGAATPSVLGNTVSWPDGDWYQVQHATTFDTICEGAVSATSSLSGGPCLIDSQNYIVINHTLQVRFENITSETSVNEESSVVVNGHVISWPDNGWYQVQNKADFMTICEGGRECMVEPGSYIVINHTTGDRSENIEVGVGNGTVNVETSDPSSIVVEGNTISWPDNGWYQVQAVSSDGIVEVCMGTRSCDVENGSYIVINHTTGDRYEDIVVSSESTDPSDPSDPVISDALVIQENNWREILLNTIDILNAGRARELHDITLSRNRTVHDLATNDLFGDGSTSQVAPLGLTSLPLEDANGSNLLLEFSCNTGGTLAVTINPGASQYASDADNCSIEDDLWDGGFFHNGAGREGFFSDMQDITVNRADSSSFSISGTLSTQRDRIGVTRSISWLDASFGEISGATDYLVDSFNVGKSSSAGVDLSSPQSSRLEDGTISFARFYLHRTGVGGSFTVRATWTDNQPLSVETSLVLDGSVNAVGIPENLPQQWTGGSLTITAADGSSIVLQPSADDVTMAVVDITGVEGSQFVSWDEGYQVWCYGDADDFADCQPE